MNDYNYKKLQLEKIPNDIKDHFNNGDLDFGFFNEPYSIAYGWGWGELVLDWVCINLESNTYEVKESWATGVRFDKEKIGIPFTSINEIPNTLEQLKNVLTIK